MLQVSEFHNHALLRLQLSYPCYHTVERQKPILPTTNQIIISAGPIQEVTTTRHDYVPKTTPKRYKIVPEGHIRSVSAPFEKQTVNKLSYDCPNMTHFTPARSCKPIREYARPGSMRVWMGVVEVLIQDSCFF